MRKLALVFALAGLAGAPLHAAQDPGLTLHETQDGGRQFGVGARASVTIPLGAQRTRDRRAVIGFDAGPVLVRSGANIRARERTALAPLSRVAIRPGYSTVWSLAGREAAAERSALAIRDSEREAEQGPRQNISTLGIVAIGVGVAAIVGGLLFIDAVRDSSD